MLGPLGDPMDEKKVALELFRQDFNCAQAVLASCAGAHGLDRDTALRVATAFGAGIARRGELCGALAGALMLAGLRHGPPPGDNREAKEKPYAAAREILASFRQRHGSVLCRELIGCDLSNPEDLRAAREARLFETRCTAFVRDAVEIARAVLE